MLDRSSSSWASFLVRISSLSIFRNPRGSRRGPESSRRVVGGSPVHLQGCSGVYRIVLDVSWYLRVPLIVSWFKGCVGKVGVTGLMLFRFACSMDRKMEPRLGSRRCRSGQLRWGRWCGMGQVRYRQYCLQPRGEAPILWIKMYFGNGKGGLNIKSIWVFTVKIQPPGHLTKKWAHVVIDVIQAALSG